MALLQAVLVPILPSWGAACCAPTFFAQAETPDWHTQVRRYAEARDWTAAMRIVDQEIVRSPRDMDVREWRARVLTWWGHLAEAETEYLAILKVSRNDPDKWLGLAGVYLREGKTQEALRAVSTAVELDPKRADLHAARARALRAAGEREEARKEFQAALRLNSASTEARAGLLSLRSEPRHELRLGNENDLFNFAGPNHDEWASLVSQWTPHWTTSAVESFYQRGGVNADKFLGSVTRRQPKWGAVTIGGAVGHDNGVIPRSEAFFDVDHGWKTSEANFVRAVELSYGQRWYWYQASRILTLNNAIVIYLPQDWTFTLGATGARSAFSGTGAEWRPSGSTRLTFPLTGSGARRLSGNVFFAAGTENFGQLDQIGSFASQTYGGGLRLQLSPTQDVTGVASYQKRTQNRTDLTFGLSYGIHF